MSTTEESTRCPSCGILYVSHPGLIPTCRELLEARAEVSRLKELATDCEALRLMTAERDRYRDVLEFCRESLRDNLSKWNYKNEPLMLEALNKVDEILLKLRP